MVCLFCFKIFNDLILNKASTSGLKRSIVIDVTFADGWNTESHPYRKLDYGKWELIIPANKDGSCPIKHLSIVKVSFGKVFELTCFR